ncbi:LOW QUALITY PROTEIN: hypothetical protein JCM19046_903 [Bacillus sp. JCM 19046]|nr:LOW QUALITY PROTEIN: hypothetical protein JCM19046_903 [Bacillus sp. JCM 19046]
MSMYEHFRPEEHSFIDQMKTVYEQVTMYHQTKLTDFLDPRQQDILAAIIGKDDAYELQFFGGADGCERKRASIRPAYLNDEPVEWNMTFLKASFSSKFTSLAHRDVLGALMNTGLKREKFGDIAIHDNYFLIACTDNSATYVRMSLEQVGRTSVQFEEMDQSLLEEDWTETEILLSSLRLDSVIAAVYGLSRGKAAEAIVKGLVKVNWKKTENTAFRLDANDYLSLRGYGRGKIITINGTTKKDKLKVTVGRKQ